MNQRAQHTNIAKLALTLAATVGLIASASPGAGAAEPREIRAIGDREAEYLLASMERLPGKAMLFPEVIAMQGLIRYGQASENRDIIARAAALYRKAYLENSSVNRLTAGRMEDQITALIPLELYKATGDQAFLRSVPLVLTMQRRQVTPEGVYRDARWLSSDLYFLCSLQAAGYQVYGQSGALDFAVAQAQAYAANKKRPWLEDSAVYWDPAGRLRGVALAQLLEVLPPDHAKQAEIKMLLAEAVERGKTAAGAEGNTDLLAAAQGYALAVGLRHGWLDAGQRKALDAHWRAFTAAYQAPKLHSFNIAFKPLIRGGATLLCASAMLELETPPAKRAVKKIETAAIQTDVPAGEIDRALALWGELRAAEAGDRPEVIEKIKADFRFDPDRLASLLVESELYRLTADYRNESECFVLLGSMQYDPPADAGLEALLFAQAYQAWRQVLLADTAIAAIEKPAGDAELKAIAVALLLDRLPPQHARRADLAALAGKLPQGKCDRALGAARRYIEAMKGGKAPPPAEVSAENLYAIAVGDLPQEEKAEQLRRLCLALQSDTGYFHQTDGQSGLCDSRSSGLAIAGVTALLETLPADGSDAAFFRRIFKRWAYAIERDQDDDGLWRVLPEDFNTEQEACGSALFTYALATGLERGWVHRLEFRDILNRAAQGLKKGAKSLAPAAPRRIASGYALLPLTTNDARTKEAISLAEAALRSYRASPVPGSDEDLTAVLGPMNEMLAREYEEELPDGRILKHASMPGKVEFERPKVHTYKRYPIQRKMILDNLAADAYPESLRERAHPYGGVTIYLKSNPSVHTITDDLGYAILAMPFVPMAKDKAFYEWNGIPTVMVAAPGYEPIKSEKYGNTIKSLKTKPVQIDMTGLPEGPSDRISGKILAEVVLEHHRRERQALLAMLGKPVEEVHLKDNKIMRPVYLRGKVISADGSPVENATVWLGRNPFLMHRSDANGEFEILMREAVLYEPVGDSLFAVAPGQQSIEQPLASYMDAGVHVTMQPLSAEPEIRVGDTLPMIRIPGGHFRMGRGLYGLPRSDRDPSTRDYDTRNCWPIRTASMPSFYLGQFFISKKVKDEVRAWALRNGYRAECPSAFTFPLFANALSEKDGLTPCYYTADKRVIRDNRDVSDNLICNWRADGYRLPTWAETIYASRAGHTTGQFWGDDGDGYGKYLIEAPTYRGTGRGYDPGGEGYTVRLAPRGRRLALDWGIYGMYLGQGNRIGTWDYNYWRTDESRDPRGPTLRETRFCDRISYGNNGRARSYRFTIFLVDNLETEWFDEWPVAPGCFHISGYANHLQNGTFTCYEAYSIPEPFYCLGRLARSAENICNDIRKLKSGDDPTLRFPGPVAGEKIGETIEMVDIPAGRYRRGSANQATWPNEQMTKGIDVVGSRPEHEVSVSAFQAAKYETTVRQWNAVQQWASKKGYDLQSGKAGKPSSDDSNHPVAITWHDAVKWCNAASEKAGFVPCYTVDGKPYRTGVSDQVVCDWTAGGYRLPTDAEWEWAAVTGMDTSYYWGDHQGHQYAWQGNTRTGNSGFKSHPVAQKIGNRFGLYDVFGNVWEWCWDWTAPYAMQVEDTRDPKGPATHEEVRAFVEGEEGKKLVREYGVSRLQAKRYVGRSLRGGDFNVQMGMHELLFGQDRGSREPDNAKDSIGFRVVRSK